MMTTHTYFALAFLVSTCSNVMIAASTSVNTTDKLNTSTPTSSTSTLSSLIPTAPPAAQSPVSTSTQSTNKSTTLHTSTNPIKPTTTFNTTTTSQKTSTSPMQKTTSKADFPEDTSELRAENKTLKTAVGILSGVIGAAVLVAVVLLFVRHRRRSRRRDPLDDNDEPTMRRNRNYFRPPSNPESVPSRLYSTSESEPMTPADKEMETFYVKNGGDKNENSTFKS